MGYKLKTRKLVPWLSAVLFRYISFSLQGFLCLECIHPLSGMIEFLGGATHVSSQLSCSQNELDAVEIRRSFLIEKWCVLVDRAILWRCLSLNNVKLIHFTFPVSVADGQRPVHAWDDHSPEFTTRTVSYYCPPGPFLVQLCSLGNYGNRPVLIWVQKHWNLLRS